MAPLDDLKQAYDDLRKVEYHRADVIDQGLDATGLTALLATKGTQLADKLADIMGWNGEA